MRRYETIYVLKPDLPDEEVEGLCRKFVQIIEDRGGRIAVEDRWGLRTLAYPVKKYRKGYYVLLDYAAEPPTIVELERNFKMIESVIRFLTVLKARDVDLEALEKEREKAVQPKESAEAPVEKEASEEPVDVASGTPVEKAAGEAEEAAESPEQAAEEG